MPGTAGQLDPETLGIVVGRYHVHDFDVAAVAGPGIDVVYPQRLGKGFGTEFLKEHYTAYLYVMLWGYIGDAIVRCLRQAMERSDVII